MSAGRIDPNVELTDDELSSLEYHGCSSGTGAPMILRDAIVRACTEIRRRRSDAAALREAFTMPKSPLEDAIAILTAQTIEPTGAAPVVEPPREPCGRH